MRAASPDHRLTSPRAWILVLLAAILGGGVLVGGASRAALGTSCGLAQCATFTVGLSGNGTGVLAVVTSTGALTGTIECHRAGGTTSGTCAFSYPLNSVIYYKVVASPGSKTTCTIRGCDLTTSVKHFTLSSNMTLSAYGFALIDPVTITVSTTGTGSGTVTSKPVGISCGGGKAACGVAFAAGSTVTLTAAASAGSSFKAWSGGCSGTQTGCTLSPTSGTPITVGARFDLIVTSTATPAPTPKPTASHGPTPRPTTAPTALPLKTTAPGRTASPVGSPAAATVAPSAGPVAAPSAQVTPAETSVAAPIASAGPSLAPLDTPAADVGQSASSPGSGSSFVLVVLVVLLIVFAGGAIVFRKPRAKT